VIPPNPVEKRREMEGKGRKRKKEDGEVASWLSGEWMPWL